MAAGPRRAIYDLWRLTCRVCVPTVWLRLKSRTCRKPRPGLKAGLASTLNTVAGISNIPRERGFCQPDDWRRERPVTCKRWDCRPLPSARERPAADANVRHQGGSIGAGEAFSLAAQGSVSGNRHPAPAPGSEASAQLVPGWLGLCQYNRSGKPLTPQAATTQLNARGWGR